MPYYLSLLFVFRLCYRYRVTILRSQFEENRNVKDHNQIKTLIENAEEQLFLNKHPNPIKCMSFDNLLFSKFLSDSVILFSRPFTWWSCLRKRAAVSWLGSGLLEPWRKSTVPRVLCQTWAEKERLYCLLGEKVWYESSGAWSPLMQVWMWKILCIGILNRAEYMALSV